MILDRLKADFPKQNQEDLKDLIGLVSSYMIIEDYKREKRD
jgi:hypothetical protein